MTQGHRSYRDHFLSVVVDYFFFVDHSLHGWGYPYVVVVNVLKCDIVVSEFEPQARYYVHFWINTPEKGT